MSSTNPLFPPKPHVIWDIPQHDAYRFFLKPKMVERSDLGIQTSTFTIPVHRFNIGSHSHRLYDLCRNEKHGLRPGIVVIKDEDPVLLTALLRYCYHATLASPWQKYVNRLWQWGINTVPELVELWDLAARFETPGLQDLIKDLLVRILDDSDSDNSWAFGDFCASLRVMYTERGSTGSTPFLSSERGRALREMMLQASLTMYMAVTEEDMRGQRSSHLDDLYACFVHILNLPRDRALASVASIMWKLRGDTAGEWEDHDAQDLSTRNDDSAAALRRYVARFVRAEGVVSFGQRLHETKWERAARKQRWWVQADWSLFGPIVWDEASVSLRRQRTEKHCESCGLDDYEGIDPLSPRCRCGGRPVRFSGTGQTHRPSDMPSSFQSTATTVPPAGDGVVPLTVAATPQPPVMVAADAAFEEYMTKLGGADRHSFLHPRGRAQQTLDPSTAQGLGCTARVEKMDRAASERREEMGNVPDVYRLYLAGFPSILG